MSKLPTGYTELEYIQSSGTQYIDTGFKPNQNSRITLRLAHTDTAASYLFSASEANPLFGLCYVGGYYAEYGSMQKQFSADLSTVTTIDVSNSVFVVGSQSFATAVADFTALSNLFLFCGNNGGSPNLHASLKLYSCQLYDNGTLVHNFVPCKNSSGAVGLYDLVGAKFYTNVGSGTFTAGPEVPKAPSAPSGFTFGRLTDTTVHLSWTASDGATGYKLYRDGILIATLTDTSYTDTIQPFTSYLYTLTAYNENGEGYAAELVVFLSPDNPILWLVTDRTQEDVTARNSKGVYQAVDLNRVGAAVEYLQKRLFAAGVLADVSPRTDWTDSMWMSAGEAKVYLDNVKTMRAALAMPKGTPTAPDDMEKLTYVEANHIEMFLVILDALLTDMVFAYRHCGVTTCGMGGLIL